MCWWMWWRRVIITWGIGLSQDTFISLSVLLRGLQPLRVAGGGLVEREGETARGVGTRMRWSGEVRGGGIYDLCFL